jgi:hypothetical protein
LLEDGHGEKGRDIYQVSPLSTCERTWISDRELLEASARFGMEAMLPDVDADNE